MQTDTRCVTGGNLRRTRERYVQGLVAEISMYSGYPSWVDGDGTTNKQTAPGGAGISSAHAAAENGVSCV